jgi:methyl-accepting chemotaxis protein
MRKKLLLAPIVAAALMIASSLAGYFGISQQHSSLQSICQEQIPALKLAADTDRTVAGVQADTYQLLSMMEANFAADQVDIVSKRLKADLDAATTRLQAAAQAAPAGTDKKQALDDAASAVIEYQKAIGEVIDIASVQVSLGTSCMSKAQAKYEVLAQQLKKLRKLEDQNTEAAYLSADNVAARVKVTVIVVMLFSVLFSIVVALYVGSSIVRSVRAIRAATAQLSQGDLRHRVPVEGSDEIAETALGINEFVVSVHDLVQTVIAGINHVTSSAGELSHASSSLAAGSARESATASNLAATVQEMTATANSIAESASILKKTSQVSLDNSDQGSKSVNNLTTAILGVDGAFDSINTSVGEFVKSTTAITVMTQQVKDLADQTNLLALNAAIEAARAGEQGRGFAVVADEVRKLAERSARAAEDIEGVTATIGQQSTGVEASLRNGMESLVSCREHASTLEAILSQSRHSVVEASSGISAIAASVTEQSKGSAEVAQHVDQIAIMAEENSSASTQSLQAAQGLETLAHSLESAVGRFAAFLADDNRVKVSPTKGDRNEAAVHMAHGSFDYARNRGDGPRAGTW